MAFVYETGVPTSQQDFVQKLFTFLTANGWTQDQLDTTNKQAAIHKGTCYVSFRWDSQASPNGAIGVCQALGYTGGQSPGNHPNTGGNITVGRRMPWIGNGPFTSYHFFLDTTADVFHGVLEFQAGLYRHLSFGTVAKVGTWTGGEFCGALYWNNAGMDNLLSSNHSVMWDLYYSTGNDVAATIHVEGLPNAPANSRWGSFWGGAAGSVGNEGGVIVGIPGRGQDAATFEHAPLAEAPGLEAARPRGDTAGRTTGTGRQDSLKTVGAASDVQIARALVGGSADATVTVRRPRWRHARGHAISISLAPMLTIDQASYGFSCAMTCSEVTSMLCFALACAWTTGTKSSSVPRA